LADAFGQEADDVVEEHHHHQQDEKVEPDLENALLDLEWEVPADDALDRDDRQVSAIKDRYRQEIENAQLERDDAHQHDQGLDAAAGGFA